MKLKKPFIGIVAFVLVLLTMPLGHSAVILLELLFGQAFKFYAAIFLGFLGILILLAGNLSKKELPATLLGLFAGLLVWTGWVEFAFMYFAKHLDIEPIIIDGEIATKPEYLLMPSTIGIWAAFMAYYLFNTDTGCRFFMWFQDKLKIRRLINLPSSQRNISLVTFMETIMLLWTFYLLLLFAYDPGFAGERHPVTYIIVFGTLLWSLILFVKLIRISNLAYAIRYAIPTVIIFWTFVEVMGRWDVFEEIWIDPGNYWIEILSMVLVLIILTGFILLNKSRNKKEQ